jgi:hypothetical protein
MINVLDEELCLPDDNKYKHFNVSISNSKNSTLDWYPMDTEELFNENLKKEPNNKTLLYYLDNPIEYRINDVGFRTDSSFNTDKAGNVFLGCSHTWGIGNHLEDVWSYKLNKVIGGEFFNLGAPGHGILTSLRLLRYWSTKLNIKNIFHYQPVYHRYEFYRPHPFLLYTDNIAHFKNIKDRDLRDALSSDENILELYKNSILAISAIAQSLGINYYYLTPWQDTRTDFENSKHTMKMPPFIARDLAHHSILENEIIANFFIEKLGHKLFV